MAKRNENIDLSTLSAGVPEVFGFEEPIFAKLFTCEIFQQSVSTSGIIIKLVQSNSNEQWFDVLDEDDNTIEETTTTTSDEIAIGSDFIEMEFVGVSIEVAGATTGEFALFYSSRSII